mgnify:CR=1 FL=1
MKGISTFTNKSINRKGSRSMERITPIKNMNLSLMDEKMHLLNSDIEELYKKYAKEKSAHQRKERSEQNLLSRIDFLIDEERKIKNKIENNAKQSDLIIKNKSLKMLKSPEIETNVETSESNRCHTMENNGEELSYKRNNKYHKSAKVDFIKMRHINNLFNIENKCKKKNEINGIILNNKYNNSVEKKNINAKNNVTNNVCIIINSPKQNESEEISNNNFSFVDVSFSKINNNNKLKTKKLNINTSEINGNNNYKKESININGRFLNNDKNINNIENKDYKKRNNNYNTLNEGKMDKSNNSIYNEEKENENLMKINNEINFIKMRLALKLQEENSNMGLAIRPQKLKDAVTQTEQIDNFSPEITEENDIKSNNINFISYNICKTETSEDDVITPTFKQKVSADNKNKSNQSLRSILYSKQRNLLSLVKEIDIKKKILRQKKISVGPQKDESKKLITLNTDNKNRKHVKKINQRCYSKTDNNINKLKSKVFKTFNHDNIANVAKVSIAEKMNKKNSSNRRNNSNSKKGLKYEFNNLSVDSDESILSRINKKRLISLKKNISLNKGIQNSIFYNKNKAKNKNMRIRYHPIDDKVYYEYDSTPNLINNMNLTFNQSIEKKRELLGLPQDIKDKIRNKIQKIDSLLKNSKDKNKQKDKFRNISLNQKKIDIGHSLKNKIKEIHKKEEKIWNRNNIANKSSRTMYNKKYSKRIINNINYKKVEANNNIYNTYNIHKKRKFDSGNYPLTNNNKYKANHPETSTQIFNNTFNNYARFSTTSKDKNINKNTSNESLTSMFSTQTNRTNRTNRTQRKIRINSISAKSQNKGNYTNNKSNDMNKYDNINKYLKIIKLIKKVETPVKTEENNKNLVMNLNDKIKDMTDIKLHEKQIKIKRQLAAIRRINQIKEDYKKKGSQLNQVNKRYLNKFESKNSSNSSNKTKNYHFHTIRRLSEIKKRPRISFTKQNINVEKSKNKSKSNRSLIQINNTNFKFFNS